MTEPTKLGHGPKAEISSPDPDELSGVAASSGSKSAASKQSRKRTKTGCLTCRKRRIKCGEERPTCKNCLKSKRSCEGYAQRVVFKHPINEVGAGGHAGQHEDLDFGAEQYGEDQAGLDPGRPLAPSRRDGAFSPVETATFPGHSPLSPTSPQEHGQSFQTQSFNPATGHYQGYLGAPYGQPPPYGSSYSGSSEHIPIDPQLGPGHGPFSSTSSDSVVHSPVGQGPVMYSTMPAQHPIHLPYVSTAYNTPISPSFNSPHFVGTFYNTFPQAHEQNLHAGAYSTPGMMQPMAAPSGFQPVPTTAQQEHSYATAPQGSSQSVEQYSSVDHLAHGFQGSNIAIRSFRNLLTEGNLVATYHPLATDSPLNNPACAQLFQHFVHSIGPLLSLQERHPPQPSALYKQGRVPANQQNLWTYKLPSLALKTPALLQAILAVSSLHMSKTQGLQSQQHHIHYSYAVQLLGRSIVSPRGRSNVGLLAVTLILSFYETMSSLHANWSKHLGGSLQMINEIDYAGMTRKIRQAMQGSVNGTITIQMALDQLNECGHQFQPHERVNIELVGELLGRRLTAEQGVVVDVAEESSLSHITTPLTRQDIDMFQAQCDLAWFFKKSDVIQSLLGRTRLSLPYHRWTDCLPRAGMGISRAVYGTIDHLTLLLARLGEFQATDAKRKFIRQKKTGGRWVPPPGFAMPGIPVGVVGGSPQIASSGLPVAVKKEAAATPTATSIESPDSTPTAPRQTPASAMPKMPGDDMSSPITPTFQDQKIYDLTGATLEAEQEWKDIHAAFKLFRDSLGPEFEPLPADLVQPSFCPFGTTLSFRTYSMASVWLYFNVGLIILHRCHPSMPAEIHMATGMAAPKCREFANAIGQIACGIAPEGSVHGQVTKFGSALIDSALPLFLAGVQYMDPQQRVWTATRLREIARSTAWDTARIIAAGCEVAWERMYAMGRGPQYTPPPDVDKLDGDDERVTREGVGLAKGEVVTVEEADGVTLDKRGRVHYAVGVLGMPENLADAG